jgi:uncharacterized protein YaaR (DUF327 family)
MLHINDLKNNFTQSFEPSVVATAKNKKSQNISDIFGILKSKNHVSLDDMEETIEQRGKELVNDRS